MSVCLVAQRCLTLCDPVDGSPPGSSVHGTLQAGVLPFSTSGDLSDPGIEPVSLESPELAGEFFTPVSPGKPFTVVYHLRKVAC